MFWKYLTGRGMTIIFLSQHFQGNDLEKTQRISIEKLLHLAVVYSIRLEIELLMNFLILSKHVLILNAMQYFYWKQVNGMNNSNLTTPSVINDAFRI